MNDTQRLAALRIVLIVVGLIAVFAIWPLMILWPSGWTWHSGHSDYLLMIVGIYATLGVFLLMAPHTDVCHYPLLNKLTTRDIDFAASTSRAPAGL
jgi:hypothetical protein